MIDSYSSVCHNIGMIRTGTTQTEGSKRRIKQNAWGNWYGYEGKRRVKAFAETPEYSMEQNAERWRDNREEDNDTDRAERRDQDLQQRNTAQA